MAQLSDLPRPPVAPPASRQRSPGITDCVEALYDAVGDDAAFRAALGGFCEHFDASGAVYLLPPDEQGGQTVAATHVPAQALTEYHSHFFAHDAWRLAAQAEGLMQPGFATRGCDIVDPEALRLSYFWREFLEPNKTKDILTGVIPPVEEDGGGCAIVSFHRAAWQPGWFARSLVPRLQEVLPHLGRALRLHRRIAPKVAVAHTLEGMFDDMDVPMLFLDRRGHLVRANQQAAEMCRQGHAITLATSGALMTRTPTGWQHVGRALAGLGQAPAVRLMLMQEDGTPAVLTLRRVHGPVPGLPIAPAGAEPAQEGADEVTAVATLRATPAELLEAFAQLYALTPAEVRTARHVVEGLSAECIAEVMGVKVSTVRTHIGHLLGKTGARRQTEFVARLRGQGGWLA